MNGTLLSTIVIPTHDDGGIHIYSDKTEGTLHKATMITIVTNNPIPEV
jgi:hypothetical protein